MDTSLILGNLSKERFKICANKLLNECFILRRLQDTNQEYNYILNNQQVFRDYFEVLGYELVVQEEYGVICLNNPAGTGRIHMKKVESILLLIIRLLFVEQKKTLLQTDDVIITAENIYDKYAMLKLASKLDKTTMRSTLSMFQRYHLIRKLDADLSNPETRIIIYPSIMFAIPTANLDEVYRASKERLEKYRNGGSDDYGHDRADDEEADEDQID